MSTSFLWPHDIFKQRRGQIDVCSLSPPTAGLGWEAALTGAIQGASRLALIPCSLIAGLWERSRTSSPAEPSGGPANTQAFRCLLAVLPDTHGAVWILWTTPSSFSDKARSNRCHPFVTYLSSSRLQRSVCFRMFSVLDLRKQADSFGSSWANRWAQNEPPLLSKAFYHLPCWDYLLPVATGAALGITDHTSWVQGSWSQKRGCGHCSLCLDTHALGQEWPVN